MWDQPDQFRPERFLQKFLCCPNLFLRFLENCEGGVRLVKKEQFVPFGFGRRVCMGEALAKDTLTIFFATLVKQLRLLTRTLSLNVYNDHIEGLRSLRATWNLTQKNSLTVSLSYLNLITSASNLFIVNKQVCHGPITRLQCYVFCIGMLT